MSLAVCISHTSGITSVVGGGIASVIQNVVRETKDEIRYTLVTSFNEKDLNQARLLYDSKVRILRAGSSSNFIIDLLGYLLKTPTNGFDVVHFHDLPLGRSLPYVLKLQLKGANLVFSYHYNPETTRYFPLNHRIGVGYYRLCFAQLRKVWRRIIVNSKYMLRDLECNNDYPSKAVVIPNGVNIEEIQSSQCLPLVGDPSFLYVGHLEWHKGVDILLGAFKQLSEREGFHNAHLHLVGSGRMETLARNFVITKNLVERVHFWGTQSQEMVFRLLKGCDILVLPSRHEASPVVLLEAMAAGKPIISTNIGGIPEMLADGRNALLVRPSQGELTKAMQYLKENGDLLKLFSRNNRKDVSLYSWKHVSEKYVKLYRSIADF